MPSTLPILISGAGISGLALAQGLLKAQLPFLIFERDPELKIRSQGYRVRINGDGIAALNSVLPSHLFSRLQASCAHVTSKGPAPKNRLDALTGKPFDNGFRIPMSNVEEESLNADRAVLRSVLMRGVEDFVMFGREVVTFERAEEGVVVKCSDGKEVKGSLLVGADGARSRIRKQLLPGTGLVDTQGRFIYGKTVLTPEFETMYHETALEGLTLIQDRSNDIPMSLLAEPIRFKNNEFRNELPADYVYWVLITRKDAIDLPDSKLLTLNGIESAALARRLTEHFDGSFHALFAMQQISKTSCIQINSVPPEMPSWDDGGLVTLIGDSAHAMSPTAVVGAATALRDSALLANLLAEEGVKTASLRKYEAAMREYAKVAVMRSQIGGKMLFAMRSFEELTSVDM